MRRKHDGLDKYQRIYLVGEVTGPPQLIVSASQNHIAEIGLSLNQAKQI